MSAGTALLAYNAIYRDTWTTPSAYKEEGYSKIKLISTIGVLIVFENIVIDDNYSLAVNITAEVKFESNKYVVVEHYVDEYGIGDTIESAQKDLLLSLVDYLTSLERRENRLGDTEKRNLGILRGILKRN